MRVHKWLLHCCALGVAVSSLAGCRAATVGSPKLVYGLTLAPSGIDPHIHASSELGIPLTSVYDTLVFLAPETGEFVPGLATAWTISDGATTYTFSLRKGVRFHDGTRFDAAAVKFNLDRVMDPGTGSQKARYMLGQLDSVTVEDEYTVTIHLAEPYAPLLDSLSQVYLGMASPTAVKRWGNADYQFHQVGTGPYTFLEYIPGDHLTLMRNSEYNWGPELYHHDRASVAEIEFRFYQDPATRAIALESGQVDIMGEIPPQDAGRLEASPDFVLHPVPIPGQPLQLFFNTTRPPTDELSVRQALIMATDRTAIVRTVFGSWSPVAYGPLSAVTRGHVPELESWYPFDPDRAGVLLAGAGWSDTDHDTVRDRDGQPLTVDLYYMGWGLMPEVAQMLESDWRAVGVQVNAQLVSYPAALEAAANGDHNVIPFNLSGTDPAQLNSFYSSGGGFNWSKINDPELDEWLSQAAAAGGWPGRLELYSRVQTRIMEEALLLPVRDYVNLNAASARVKGLRFDARGWFPLLVDVQLVDVQMEN